MEPLLLGAAAAPAARWSRRPSRSSSEPPLAPAPPRPSCTNTAPLPPMPLVITDTPAHTAPPQSCRRYRRSSESPLMSPLHPSRYSSESTLPFPHPLLLKRHASERERDKNG
uniref:Uncharacterized protein n=1 Tax=Oryza glumipatula TaxID=40148 RepID=A0A0E0BAC5_9ORYZ